MEIIRTYQLSIMLFMSGICGILAFMTLMTRFLSRERKSILALMELSAMLLLLFDRFSYIYRGDVSELGFVMVRVSNGLVFFLSVFIPHLVTEYLKDLYRNEGRLPFVPASLKACEVLFVFGAVLIVVSQFTGLYYTFDAQNNYQRAPGFVLSYFAPVMIVLLQEIIVIRYRRRLSPGFVISLILSISLPTVFSVVQIFHYGVSLTEMSTVLMVIIFYIYTLSEMDEAVETARMNELASYKEAERREAAMFEETAEALANAIDAKDKYTRGHSARVAAISKLIAEEAGFSDADCRQIYYSALLHDVGKIGIRDDVINKEGRLTEEEFEQIKLHPILGNQILSSIRQSPSLCVGAHYHHERYDGTGYPEGLAGGDIPEIARIISVADAFDAMTSTRSYRGKLPIEKTKEELIRGMGRQFDPKYAQILLDVIDSGQLQEALKDD